MGLRHVDLAAISMHSLLGSINHHAIHSKGNHIYYPRIVDTVVCIIIVIIQHVSRVLCPKIQEIHLAKSTGCSPQIQPLGDWV